MFKYIYCTYLSLAPNGAEFNLTIDAFQLFFQFFSILFWIFWGNGHSHTFNEGNGPESSPPLQAAKGEKLGKNQKNCQPHSTYSLFGQLFVNIIYICSRLWKLPKYWNFQIIFWKILAEKCEKL